MIETWPEKCKEKFADYEARLAEHQASFKIVQLTEQHTLYRLLQKNDIEVQMEKPKERVFSNPDFSVLAEGPELPQLDVEKEIKASNGKFVGAVIIKPDCYPETEYYIRHDPLPYGDLAQHANHAQVFCKKNNAKCRSLQASCTWFPNGQMPEVSEDAPEGT